MSTLSLKFRSHDSKSTFIITWQNGEIIKHYNSRKSVSLLAEPPQSIAQFESICRNRFMLGQKWQCTSLIGERAA